MSSQATSGLNSVKLFLLASNIPILNSDQRRRLTPLTIRLYQRILLQFGLPAPSNFPCSSLRSASVNRFSFSFSSYKQRTTYFFVECLIILPSLSHAKYFPPHFAISQHAKIIGQGMSFKSRSINTRQYKLYKNNSKVDPSGVRYSDFIIE